MISPESVKNSVHVKVIIVDSRLSVSDIDFDRFSGIDFLMVNGATLALPEERRYGYYFALDDHFVLDERADIVMDSIKNAKISFVS